MIENTVSELLAERVDSMEKENVQRSFKRNEGLPTQSNLKRKFLGKQNRLENAERKKNILSSNKLINVLHLVLGTKVLAKRF